VLLFGLALAVPAGGGARPDDAWARLAPPGVIRAGESVSLRLGAAPRGVDECEVLLSLDDGRTFPVRVTRELEAGERELRWRVPNLPTLAARLRVRYRLEGREVEGPLGARFEILGEARSQETGVFHEGAGWEGWDAGGAPAPASLSGSTSPVFAAATRGLPAEPSPSAPSLAPAPDTRSDLARPAPREICGALRHSFSPERRLPLLI
jgi:hypothetical protein